MVELTDIDIARVCYATNKAYCEALGDHSFGEWEDAPQWQRDTIINGVNFHLDGSGGHREPEASHENWLAMKESEGWVYGEVKDAEKKIHPCMVPFEELSKEQQMKDYLFAHTVRTLSPLVGDGTPDKSG